LKEDALRFGRFTLNDERGQQGEKNTECYKPSRVCERSAKIQLAIPIAPHRTPKGQLLLTVDWFAEVGSPVAKEEIGQRAEEQYKQEERDDPTAAGFGGDWGIADRAAHAADVRVYRFRVS
jgi:hypothetical protein